MCRGDSIRRTADIYGEALPRNPLSMSRRGTLYSEEILTPFLSEIMPVVANNKNKKKKTIPTCH